MEGDDINFMGARGQTQQWHGGQVGLLDMISDDLDIFTWLWRLMSCMFDLQLLNANWTVTKVI